MLVFALHESGKKSFLKKCLEYRWFRLRRLYIALIFVRGTLFYQNRTEILLTTLLTYRGESSAVGPLSKPQLPSLRQAKRCYCDRVATQGGGVWSSLIATSFIGLRDSAAPASRVIFELFLSQINRCDGARKRHASHCFVSEALAK
jgi:hypothetical protein